MIYLQLFLSFLQIGAFSFGGGYAAMPLIQNQVVQLHPWLSQSEFTDLITISQMTPGPIAVNSATFVGTRIAGVPGALAATIGCVLPSCILVTILAKIYLKYRNLSLLQDILKSLRPAVIAMIAAAGVSILVTAFWGNDISSLHLDAILSSTNIRAVGIFLVSLILLAKFKMDPIHVMLLSGGAEVVMQLIMKLL
jgi:chromate transporter